MANYYVALQSRSHAFVLERRLTGNGIQCELTYLPREIMRDLCNMGIKFEEPYFRKAMDVIYQSGLPGFRVYREEAQPWQSSYLEIQY